MRFRRTAYAFFYLEDDYLIDVAALLRGDDPAPAPRARVLAMSLLTGRRERLTSSELELLGSIPADRWVRPSAGDRARCRDLAERGLLVADEPPAGPGDRTDGDEADPGADPLAQLRGRDEALARNQWNMYAALFHYMTQWSGVDIREGDDDDETLGARTREGAQAMMAQYGPPPPPFAPPRGSTLVTLPRTPRTGHLYRTLTARHTTRAFDGDRAMTIDELDTVLQYVFGCHGYSETAAGVCIKRTSPSGGGLHAIEVYPVISNVTGVTPGVYHYDVRDHELHLLGELDAAAARTTVTSFVCGQSYFGAAHVSFVLTARFLRSHWKYRRHQKAYPGLLMDAAHLSQTLYLVSADLGLGAYITIAINGQDIERRLGLDGIDEGVLAVLGCGPRRATLSALEPRFQTGSPDGR